jgi:outer membrane biogenesis lipoprotein LolB
MNMSKALRALVAVIAAILLFASVPAPAVTHTTVQWQLADPNPPDGG